MAVYKSLVKKVSVSSERKMKQKDYLTSGTYPVIDQGQKTVGGYCDDETKVINCELPVIVFGDHTRVVKYINFPFVSGADGTKVLQPKETILPKYLYYGTIYLAMIMPDRGYARHYQYIEKMDLPVPKISEQKRIVDYLDEFFSQIETGIEEIEKVKQQLAVYRQAILKEEFEDIEENCSLDSISERIFDGPFGSNLKTADYKDEGIRVVRLENIKHGWFDDSKKSFITKEKYDSISSHTVYPTDVIMSTFIADNIKVCQMPNSIEFAVNKADCVGIRLKQKYVQKYVMYYLMSKQAYNDLVHEVHGATRPRVNTKQMKKLMIPVCDIKQQIQIVKSIENRFSVCDSIEQTVNTVLQQAEAMRQSILKEAFEGRL